MPRKRTLFCELSPAAYQISVAKCQTLRRLRDVLLPCHFAKTRSDAPLPCRVYQHRSLIRRRLGHVDAALQENKAVNLSIAAPAVSGVLIRPGETFSFWRLVGNCTAQKGYLNGLVIRQGAPDCDVGGGLCQLSNLIHWLVLHTPLQIIEHHHHDGVDLFPDFGRQVPFGCGTSILYNYLDYRFYNPTDLTFQLLIHPDQTHLCGEIRADARPGVRWHVRVEEEFFSREGSEVYRNGTVWRTCVDRRTGNTVARELLKQNHARVLYDTAGLPLRAPSACAASEGGAV